MTTTTPEPAVPAEAPEAPAAPPKTQSLEELLSDLDDDRRKVILDQVGKSRSEAKNLRERLKQSEPKIAEYDRLVQASKTDQERAEEARKAAEERASSAFQRMARAEVKSALAGLVDNPDEIVDDLNLSRFVDEDGEVNADAIATLRARYAGLGGSRIPRPDPSQGSSARGGAAADPASQFADFIKRQRA